MIYQYYDPNIHHVCRMGQYQCCKNHLDTCPLAETCKSMDFKKLTSVCKRDCPSCTYEGCSMPMEQRKVEPLYVGGSVTTEMKNLRIEIIREREHLEHQKNHARLWYFYNSLWGDAKEKKKAYRERTGYNKYYYWKNRERQLEYQEKRRRKQGMRPMSERRLLILPPCGGDCLNCQEPDCILPENWNEKNEKVNRWRRENSEYYHAYRKQYYEDNIERERERLRKWREDNPEKLAAQRARYNEVRRKNYEEKKEEINRKRREHYAKNRERIAEQKRQWTRANKDMLNARRKEKRRLEKMEQEKSAAGM